MDLMTLGNRATLSMQHYAAVTTAICHIEGSRSRATTALMFIPLEPQQGRPARRASEAAPCEAT